MALYSVVKFEGIKKDWLLYKFPSTEFNTNSKLIVTTGQVAILVHNGKIEKICEEGSYFLNTELIPFVKGYSKKVHGGSNPYPMEVYFVNKTIKLDMLWGTSQPIVILDPVYKVQINLRARGQFGVKLDNYQYFLQTLVGTLMRDSYVTYEIISDYFRGIINQTSKELITSYILKNKVTYFEILAHLSEIRSEIERSLFIHLEEFGFKVINMSIEALNAKESDLARLNEILHKKAEYEQLGDNIYRTSRGYDVLEKGAENNSSAGTIMGVGLGMNMTNQLNSGSIIPPANTSNQTCSNCNSPISDNQKFCSSCGQKILKNCNKCNSEVQPGQKFCSSCGEKL